MRDWKPAAYKRYNWIVRDADLLGGKLAVRGTRLSVSFVLACLAEGMSTEEIAQRLFISEHTVRSHVKNMLAKLGVSSRREALERLARARG